MLQQEWQTTTFLKGLSHPLMQTCAVPLALLESGSIPCSTRSMLQPCQCQQSSDHAEPAAALAFGGSDLQQQIPTRAWHAPIPIAARLSRVTNLLTCLSISDVWLTILASATAHSSILSLPSLLRHLCDAPPGLLALLHVALVTRFKDGTLGHAVARLTTGMRREAAMLAPYIAPCCCWLQPQARTTIEESRTVGYR